MNPEHTTDTNDINRKIMERLGNLEKKDDRLSSLVQIYRELLEIQIEAKLNARVARLNLDENLRQERLRKGIPLLLFEDFHLNWDQVQAVFKRIIAWSADDSEAPCKGHGVLQNIGSDLGFLRDAAEVWYRGLSLKRLCVSQGIDSELLTSIIGATLKPFLSAYSSSLLTEVDQELWRRNTCPICGGNPDFASLKEGGQRWLLCSRCDGEWLFSRIECPYCGTRNQEALAYFASEEETSLYRLYVCEECRGYIKGIDLRVIQAEPLLPLERILTLDLDIRGQENGYQPGWPWVNKSTSFEERRKKQ